jgi:transcriptional regulator with XRE-family HTH domain
VEYVVTGEDALRGLVRAARRGQGLRLHDVADSAGVCIGHLANFERGDRSMSPPLLLRTLAALNLQVIVRSPYPPDAACPHPHLNVDTSEATAEYRITDVGQLRALMRAARHGQRLRLRDVALHAHGCDTHINSWEMSGGGMSLPVLLTTLQSLGLPLVVRSGYPPAPYMPFSQKYPRRTGSASA